MPRLKLIMNPASDRGNTAQIGEALQALLHERAIAASSREGETYTLDWVLTERPRHATELALQAAQEGFDIVVAVGGDGTVHEVINGLMRVDEKQRPVLGVLPVGTGNDFVHNLGISTDENEAAHALFTGQIRKIDIGVIEDDRGQQQYWDNTIGIGFSGVVNIMARKLTKGRGFLIYLIAVLETILFHPPFISARVQIDDQPATDRIASMISLCNGPREGGGFPVAPNAVMDDGMLTYMFMRGMGRLRMLYFLPIVMKANHLKHEKYFEENTARKIRIEADQDLVIHADGEIFSSWETNVRKIEVSIEPAALKVLCNR